MKKVGKGLYHICQQWMDIHFNPFVRPFILSNRGFTLSELLITAFLSSIVLGVSGLGVVSVLGASKASSSQSVRRMEMDRSLEFIATEMQQAIKINEDTTTPFAPKTLNPDIDPASMQVVFRLTIPGLNEPITYYIAEPRQLNRPWVGPRVVYRWGPLLDNQGKYLTDDWAHLPLIDSIEDSDAPFDTTATSVDCPGDSATPGSKWVATPLNARATGFYGCVDPTNRIAQIFHRGRIYKAFGKTEPYLAQEQAFARAATIGGASTSTITVPVATGRTQVPQNSTVDLQILGSDIRCGATGIPMRTRLMINVSQPDGTQQSQTYTIEPNNSPPTSLNPVDLQAGGSISYTGMVPPNDPPGNNPNNICSLDRISNGVGFNSDTNLEQVRVLKHGDPVPDVTGFGGSLGTKAMIARYVDTSTDRISLPDPQKQAIILFELGTTDQSRPAFDSQDIAILAISNPTP
jgi:hypothetical protein